MYSSSGRPPRTLTLKERLNSSKPTKMRLRLPDAARTLYELMQSNDVFLKIVGSFGGCTLRVPAKWPPHGKKPDFRGHPLRKVLNPTQMKQMVGHYGGTDLYIPKCTKYIMELRNDAIIKGFTKFTSRGKSAGDTVRFLARRYRLSDRRIWDILKQYTENLS